MKLSIAMMVKNEEKNLERCLESLDKLRKSIKSELIIVDTGSNDNTVEIAKKYTKNIYFHKWNNNFSDMRNITTKYCSGEWIFIIDADECLDNDTELINILNEKINKSIGVITLNVKNFTSSYNESEIIENTSPRIFKNDGFFRYEGAVHNSPKYNGKAFECKSYLNHYGYIMDDKELMEYKFKRTSGILKSELEKNPHNIYYMYQLTVSYQMHNDINLAFEQIKKAYPLLKNDIDRKKHFYVYPTYAQLLVVFDQYDEAIRVAREGIKIYDQHIDLYYYIASAYLRTKRYDESVKSYEKYIYLINNWDKLEMKNNVAVKFNTLKNKEEAYFNLFIVYYRLKQYDKAKKQAWCIKRRELVERALNTLIDIGIECEEFRALKEFIDEKNKLPDINELSLYLILNKKIKNLDYEVKKIFLKEFAGNDTLYARMCCIQLKQILGEECKDESIEFLRLVTAENKDNEELYHYNVIYLSCIYKVSDTSKYFINLSDESISDLFKAISDNYSDFGKMIINRMDLFDSISDEYEKIRIKKVVLLCSLLIGKLSKEDYKDTFNYYVENGTKYIKYKYSDYIISNEKIEELQNNQEIFFIYIIKAFENKASNSSSYISYLKKAVNAYPYMKIGVEILMDELNSKINSVHQEFELYKKLIKEDIERLVSNNELDTAEAIISEYEKINGVDMEICSTKAVINIMKGNLDEAESIISNALMKDFDNFDLNYNLAYLYGIKKEKELELEFYKKALTSCDDAIRDSITDKIICLKSNFHVEIDQNISYKYEKLREEIDKGNTDGIINCIKNLIKAKKFEECLVGFNYYIKYSDVCIPEMYYFAGLACCGLEKFEQSIKYHNLAIKLNSKLSNIVDGKNISVDYALGEKVSCIGCSCDEFDIVNVSNQSIYESNKGIINPIRVWVKCNECGLVYGNPLPSEEDLNKYYLIIAKEKFGGIYGDIKQRESFLFNMSDVRLDNIGELTEKKTLLDIGTGIGFFVKCALKRGYNAYGLELTTEDCEYAKKHYGLDLIQRNFYSFTESEQYDIVTMFEVIEHMRTPLKDLKRINKLVKMDGIFVLATPILDSKYGKETKEKNIFWNVVAHLSYFTKKTLKVYLENSGFEVIKIADSLEGLGRMDFYCKKVREL